MKTNFSGTEIPDLLKQLETVFDRVSLVSAQEATEQEQEQAQTKGLGLQYTFDDGATVCNMSHQIMVDGVAHYLRMSAPVAQTDLPTATLTARELQMHNDDLIRDFLSGAYNRHYWETVFCPNLAQKQVAVALITIDHFDDLVAQYGEANTDALICYVANQWKKFYDENGDKVVCRMSHHAFAIGCIGADELDLESQLRYLYEQMNLVCTSTCGMLCHIPFTLSIACASTSEVKEPTWAELLTLCESRLREVAQTGGNGVAYAEQF